MHLNTPLNNFRMPLRNKKSQQAASQRVAGSQFFSKQFIENLQPDFVSKDPDYNDTEAESDSDLDDNAVRDGWAFSLADDNNSKSMPDLDEVSDSEDEDEEQDGDKPEVVGTKRKAPVEAEVVDSDGESECEGVEEKEALVMLKHIEVIEAQTAGEKWKDLFAKVRIVSRL